MAKIDNYHWTRLVLFFWLQPLMLGLFVLPVAWYPYLVSVRCLERMRESFGELTPAG